MSNTSHFCHHDFVATFFQSSKHMEVVVILIGRTLFNIAKHLEADCVKQDFVEVLNHRCTQ